MVVRNLKIALVTGNGGRGGRGRGEIALPPHGVGGWRCGDGVRPGRLIQQGARFPWVPRMPEAQEGPSPKLGCSFSSARLRQRERWSGSLVCQLVTSVCHVCLCHPKKMWLLCLLVPGLLQPQFVCSRGFRVCPGFEQSPPEESVPWGLGCLEAAGCSHGHELGSRSGLSPPPPTHAGASGQVSSSSEPRIPDLSTQVGLRTWWDRVLRSQSGPHVRRLLLVGLHPG